MNYFSHQSGKIVHTSPFFPELGSICIVSEVHPYATCESRPTTELSHPPEMQYRSLPLHAHLFVKPVELLCK